MIFVNYVFLYAFSFLTAFILSLILTPAARSAAYVLDIFDHPSSEVKTHKEPVPYLGGVAIFLAFSFSLSWLRVLSNLPTGTLRSLRGILAGGVIIFLTGLIDDIKKGGLSYKTKFFLQLIASSMLVLFGMRIRFVQPVWFAYALTFIWIVGITNAFNIIDIMDGLSSGVGVIAAFSFLVISLPTEEKYVNFAAAALAGAALGFFPYNVSRNWRIFMGDSGSLFLGFVAGALSLGTSYSKTSQFGVLAPLLILAVPIFDTLLVFTLRALKGMSPFRGSKDHFPLRLEALGWGRKTILFFILMAALIFSTLAFLLTKFQLKGTLIIGLITLVFVSLFVKYLLKAAPQ